MDNYFDSLSTDNTYHLIENGERPFGDESLVSMRDLPNPDSLVSPPFPTEGGSLSFEMPMLPPYDNTTALQGGSNTCSNNSDDMSLSLFCDELPTETDLSSNYTEQPTLLQQGNNVPSEKEDLEWVYDTMVMNTLHEPSVWPFTEVIIQNSPAIVTILNSPKRRTYWGDYHKLLRDLCKAIRKAKGDGNHGPYSISRIAKALLNGGILRGCTNPQQAFRRLCGRLNRKDNTAN